MFRARARGSSMLAGAVLVSMAVGGCGSTPTSSNAPSSVIPSSGPTSAPASTVRPIGAPKPVLGPHGYGTLRIGMSEKAAVVTGELVPKEIGNAEACKGFDLRRYPTPKNSVGVYISKTHGLVAIFAGKDLTTPEEIGIGSTLAEVKRAYPRMVSGENGITARVPGNPAASYTILVGKNKQVRELALAATNQDCFG